MAIELFANQPSTTVSSGGTTAPSPGTVESWTVASSASFPAASNSSSPPTQFHVCDTASGKISEIILVTNVSGTTWTVTRGAESTTPVAHTAGFTIQQVVTAGWLGSGVVYAAGGGRETTANNSSATGSVTLDITNGNVLSATLTGNTTFTFAGAASGVACSFTLYLSQDATGGRTVTWPGSVTWIGGTAPTLATAASALNVLVFQTLNGGTTWYGALIQELPTFPLSLANGGTGGSAASYPALLALIGAAPLAGATFTGWVAPSVVTLSQSSGTVAVNAALGNAFNLPLSGSSWTIATPTNPVDGQVIRFRLQQGTAAPPYPVVWGAGYDFGSGTSPTLSTSGGKVDIAGYEYVGLNSKWCYLGSGLGF